MAAIRSSAFVAGGWVPVVGAGVFALGCGRLVVVARGMGGAGANGLASATTARDLALPIVLMVLGALVLVAGGGLVTALRASAVARGGRWFDRRIVQATAQSRSTDGSLGVGVSGWPGSGVMAAPLPSVPPFAWRRLIGPPGIATLLAVAAGLIAGLNNGSGPVMLVGSVVALSLLVVVFWRPETMLLAVAAFPWVDWAARHTLGSLGPAWDDAFLVLSFIVLLWCVLVLRRSALWTIPIMLPLLLAFAAAIGSIMLEHVPGDVAFFALRLTFEPLLFFFLGFLFPKNRRWVQWVVAVFVVASVALALHGLYQYVTHAPMPAQWVDIHETDISTRAYSIIGNPNGLGAFLLLGSLLSLSFVLTRGLRSLYRALMAVACVVQLLGVAVTFSRGAWLGLGAGILALLILAHRRYLAPLVAAGVVGWFLVPQQFIGRLTFALSSTYITKSLTAGRLFVWKMAVDYITAHPLFGVGLGTFGGTSAVMFGYGRYWVDNFYLQLGAEGGLILLFLFLWILLRTAKGLVKSHGLASDPFWRGLTAGIFGGFIAVVIANVTASVWETLVVGVGFWFLAGLATSAVFQSNEVATAEKAVSSADEAGVDAGPGASDGEQPVAGSGA